MKLSLANAKLEGALTKAKLQKDLTEHFKAQGVHPKLLTHLRASGFFSDVWSGIKKGVSVIAKPALGALTGYVTGGPAGALSGALGALGSGKPRGRSTKMTQRGQMISKLMKSNHMTLGQASAYLKQAGK